MTVIERQRPPPALTRAVIHQLRRVHRSANGNLWVEDCDVKELADRSAPALHHLGDQLRYTYRHFRDAFSPALSESRSCSPTIEQRAAIAT